MYPNNAKDITNKPAALEIDHFFSVKPQGTAGVFSACIGFLFINLAKGYKKFNFSFKEINAIKV